MFVSLYRLLKYSLVDRCGFVWQFVRLVDCSVGLFVFGAAAPSGPGPPHSRRFLDHTQWRTTVGRTPLDEWSARRRDLYLTTHKTHNRHTQWLGRCATNRKVAGSIPVGVSWFFIDIKSFRSHYGLGVDSACNRNEYQEHFLGVKVAGA